jgi:trehalose-phosphatase
MTTAEPVRAAAAIREARARRHLLLLLDFDGTLCEFDPDPDAVELSGPRRALLLGLAVRPDVTVGVVSGRRLQDVRRRTQISPRAYYSGLHGLEIEGPGVSFIHPEAERGLDAIRRVSASLRLDLSGMPGVFLEDKTLSVAAHFREAAPEDAVRVREIVATPARSSSRACSRSCRAPACWSCSRTSTGTRGAPWRGSVS